MGAGLTLRFALRRFGTHSVRAVFPPSVPNCRGAPHRGSPAQTSASTPLALRSLRTIPCGMTQAWLEAFLKAHGGIAGTVHVVEGGALNLRAQVNIPPPVVAVTRLIPKGKGMAGLAWEREVPVQTCNLKTDETGDVRPGAKAVSAQAAVALPVLDGGGAVRAVVGIAFMGEREFTDAELESFAQAAKGLP
jgi:L-methionine (R)-S-oxide reductase